MRRSHLRALPCSRVLWAGLLLLALTSPVRADLSDLSFCEPDGVQASGAAFRICMPGPALWNGDLVIWAHAYVPFNEPLAITENDLCFAGPDCLPDLVNALGFGFATTSFSENGLAVVPGIADVVDLVGLFEAAHGPARRVYLVGASQGGLVTALAVERYPGLFDGGLASCARVGDFSERIRSAGDARVILDYFFPGLLPGSVDGIPEWVFPEWDTLWSQVIRPELFDPANAAKISQIMGVMDAPFPVSLREVAERGFHDILRYLIFATDDTSGKLGGQPYENINTLYVGSLDDDALNAGVQRVAAFEGVRERIEAHYQTSGELQVPLVTLFNSSDLEQENLYRQKVLASGSGSLHQGVRGQRSGHCRFTLMETMVSFATLVSMASGEPLTGIEKIFPTRAGQRRFHRLVDGRRTPRDGRSGGER